MASLILIYLISSKYQFVGGLLIKAQHHHSKLARIDIECIRPRFIALWWNPTFSALNLRNERVIEHAYPHREITLRKSGLLSIFAQPYACLTT